MNKNGVAFCLLKYMVGCKFSASRAFELWDRYEGDIKTYGWPHSNKKIELEKAKGVLDFLERYRVRDE